MKASAKSEAGVTIYHEKNNYRRSHHGDGIMKHILLSEIITLEESGAYRLEGWTRKKNNRIDEQSQRWLRGKEYFFSSYTQEKKYDAREMKRRANQDSVRQHHQEAISSFLQQYQYAASIIRDSFIPNYNTVLYDDFQLDKTIQRLFRYGLVEKDIECEKYAKRNFDKTIYPETYWKHIVANLNSSNIKDAILNPITLDLFPELRLYKKIQKTFIWWYIDRMFSMTITETSHVFCHCEFYKDKPDQEICDAVLHDFEKKIKQDNYRALFELLHITHELVEESIQATLNEQGRQKEFDEWSKKSGAYRTFQDILNRKPSLFGPYTILGIEQNATHQEIKSAFRAMCNIHHPDKGGDAHKFIEITDAYDKIKQQRRIK